MKDFITITRKSPISKTVNSMDIPLSLDKYQKCASKYMEGAHVQDAFPTLNADQREFIITGITPEEWEEMMEHEDEELDAVELSSNNISK